MKDTSPEINQSSVFDPLELWEIAEKKLKKMSKKEMLEKFVRAGILTENGNVTKPYRGVFEKSPSHKVAQAS